MNRTAKIKPSFNTHRKNLGEILPLQSPLSVILDVSDLCNLKCNYCFRTADPERMSEEMAWGSRKLLKKDTFTKILDQIAEFKEEPKKIALSGHGEPLSNRKLPQMVREIKKRFTSVVEIHTNATLLTEQYAIELIDSGIDKIIVSLQGLTAEKYREVCDFTLDFEKFYHHLSVLFHHKTHAEINIKIADVALEASEKEKFYSMFSPIADKVFVERTVPIWEDVDAVAPLNHQNVETNKFGRKVAYVNCCSIMFYTLLVSPEGKIYPCTQALMTIDLGSVHEVSLKEAWESERRMDLLKAHLSEGRHSVKDCKACYVAQNSVLAEADYVDPYRNTILQKIIEGEK